MASQSHVSEASLLLSSRQAVPNIDYAYRRLEGDWSEAYSLHDDAAHSQLTRRASYEPQEPCWKNIVRQNLSAKPLEGGVERREGREPDFSLVVIKYSIRRPSARRGFTRMDPSLAGVSAWIALENTKRHGNDGKGMVPSRSANSVDGLAR